MAEATTSPASSVRRRRRRVLMFPVPFQGHLTPMLQLAGALHARGGGQLDVTVFHAAFNAPDAARRPAGYRFVPVGEGVPSADLVPSGSDADFAGALLRINERLREPFRDCLRQALLADEEGGGGAAPACLVVDSNLRGMQLVAQELGVPTLVLRTGGAACLVAYMAFPALCDKALLPPASQGSFGSTKPRGDPCVFPGLQAHAEIWPGKKYIRIWKPSRWGTRAPTPSISTGETRPTYRGRAGLPVRRSPSRSLRSPSAVPHLACSAPPQIRCQIAAGTGYP